MKFKLPGIVAVTIVLATLLSFNINKLAYAQVGDVDSGSNSCVDIQNNLRYKMRDASVGNEVSDLQDYLISEGYLSGQTTGYFGAATLKAVKNFQTQNGLLSSGYVGPITRAKVKSLSCGQTSVTPSNPTVITPSYPGMVNVTYYYINSNKTACVSGVFVGNTGPRVSNGQYVYQTGEYRTEQECKSANGLSANPVACTMEYRSCPDGTAMPRDNSCGWHPEQCKQVSTNSLKITSLYAGIIPNQTPSDTQLYKIEVYGQNLNQADYIETEKLVDGVYNVYRPYFTEASDNKIVFNYKVCAGCNYTMYIKAKAKGGLESNALPIVIDNSTKKVKISFVTLLDRGQSDNKVELTINGSGFNSISPLVHVNSFCSIGGTLLSEQTDTKIVVAFVRDYFYSQCVTPGTNASIYISGFGVDNSNTYSLSIPNVNIAPRPSITSTYFDLNNTALTFTGYNFKTVDNGAYYVSYKFDCASNVNCSGSLLSLKVNENNMLTFSLDQNIMQNAKGYITYRLEEKGGSPVSQTYVVPYTQVQTIIDASNGINSTLLNNDMINGDSLSDFNYRNNKTLETVNITKGQYQSIEVRYSCNQLTFKDGSGKENFSLNGTFKIMDGTKKSFWCPSGLNTMKGGMELITVANITSDKDQLSYMVNYFEGWSAGYATKYEPMGELFFYGVNQDGSKTFIKSINFMHSIKG